MCSWFANKLLGVFAGGEGWGEGKKHSLPCFFPLPHREFPLSGESVVNQSINFNQSFNLSVSYKDAPDSILFLYRVDYPGYLV